MLTAREQRQLVRALEQQLWFWGQDVLSPWGNLLVSYGFTKWKPRFVPGSSRYRLGWRDRVIELHSFCAGIYGGEREGFIYIRAHDAVCGYAGQQPPCPDRYRREWLRPVSIPALAEFCEWILDYERWLDTHYGEEYRVAVYRRYHRQWRAPRLARAWMQQWIELNRRGCDEEEGSA